MSVFEQIKARMAQAHEEVAKAAKPKDALKLPTFNGYTAQLISLGLTEVKQGANAGKPMAFGRGVILSPEKVGDVEVVGAFTNMRPIILADTTDKNGKVTTFEQNMETLYKTLFALGVDMDQEDPENLEEIMKKLVDDGVTFSVNVVQKGEWTNTYWNKLRPNNVIAKAEYQEQVEDGTEDISLPDLLVKAQQGSMSAKETLTKLAISNGASKEDVENADSWDVVVEMITGKKIVEGSAVKYKGILYKVVEVNGESLTLAGIGKKSNDKVETTVGEVEFVK